MSEIHHKKIALLIDGDNANAKYCEGILNEAGKQGKVTVKRIYADWTNNRLSSWKEILNKFSIRPMQKFEFASGKNSTDTAMIIDAMDLLHARNVSGFCIASSDSDYTGLVQRIKEGGLFVMGIGDAKVKSKAFINACDLFVFTENLGNGEDEPAKKAVSKTLAPPQTLKQLVLSKVDRGKLPKSKITKEPIDIEKIITAWEMVADDNGWAYTGELGMAIRKLDPGFDPRTYDSPTLSKLFRKMPECFEIQNKDNINGTPSVFFKLIKPK